MQTLALNNILNHSFYDVGEKIFTIIIVICITGGITKDSLDSIDVRISGISF